MAKFEAALDKCIRLGKDEKERKANAEDLDGNAENVVHTYNVFGQACSGARQCYIVLIKLDLSSCMTFPI